MGDQGWIVVRRKKRGIQKTRIGVKPFRAGVALRESRFPHEGEKATPEKVLKASERLEELRKGLERNTWWERTSQLIRDGISGRDVVAFHCLGIGSFANCVGSRYQFACALLIRACFAGNARCTVADPAMGGVDREVAQEQNFEVVETTSIDWPRPVPNPITVGVSRPGDGECVLWFMPHCPKELYECVLEKCGRFGYYGMIFFGNKLSQYGQEVWAWCKSRPPGPDERCPNLEGLCEGKLLEERDCPDSRTFSPCEGAFNDLSVITIKTEGQSDGIVE